MSDLKKRVKKLEQRTGGNKKVVVFIVYDGDPDLSRKKKDELILEYKASHPDWGEKDFIIIDTKIPRPDYPDGKTREV